MNSRVAQIDTGAGVSFIVSAVIHLAVFLLLAWWGQQFPQQMTIQETYYVDVVNMPANAPQSGGSTQKPGESAAVPPTPVAAPVMAIPSKVKAVPKITAKSSRPAAPDESAVTESAFAERLTRLESSSEARREEAILEKIRNKVKSANLSKAGAQGAAGVEAGSRYADYIKSRLEDALKVTSSYRSKRPEVAVRLTIAADGKLSRMKIERSSGDATFELAVRRAIDLASEKFTVPPNHAVFENGFIFKPEGISNGPSR